MPGKGFAGDWIWPVLLESRWHVVVMYQRVRVFGSARDAGI